MGGQPLPVPESGFYPLFGWAICLWLAWIGYRGHRTGRMRWYASIDDRRKDPAAFRVNMATWLLFFVCMIGASAFLTVQWIGRQS